MKRLGVLALTCACASTGSDDGGTDAATDAPLACELDAGPSDAGDGGPIQDMAATNPPYQGACTAAQVADYVQCQGAKNADFCAEFKAGGSAAACGACIETPFAAVDGGAGTWGVLVFNGSTAFFNVEGCINDALGTTDCGNDLHHLYECEEFVCGGCTGSDFPSCELESANDPSFCGTYAAEVADAGGPCAAIDGDAMPPATANCFPDTTIQDPTVQEEDFLRRIVSYMCGAPPDAGP